MTRQCQQYLINYKRCFDMPYEHLFYILLSRNISMHSLPLNAKNWFTLIFIIKNGKIVGRRRQQNMLKERHTADAETEL